MGYWDYNETTGQPYYVEDTPDPSGGAQENDPNYLYLQGYEAPYSGGDTQSGGPPPYDSYRYDENGTTPDPSGGAQENDPNYLYLQGYRGGYSAGDTQSEGPPLVPSYGVPEYSPPEPQPILPPDWNAPPSHYADTSRFPSGAGGMPKMSYGQRVQRAIALSKTPIEAVRDEALATNPWWTETQRNYLSDIPVAWAEEMGGGGTYYPETGRITLHPDNSRGATRVAVMRHELEHALYGNMLSPREQAEWAGEYANAVLTGRMQPVKERNYFQQYPGDRAIEMYPTRPADLPQEMQRFYNPPSAPVNQWPVPIWRSQSNAIRGY